MMLCLRPREILPLYEWAMEHIRVPSGPHAGSRLSASAQPVSDLVLRAMSETTARAVVLVAPAQSGKSLVGWLIPLLYWSIERGAPVGMGVPTRYLCDDLIAELRARLDAAARHLDAAYGPGPSSALVDALDGVDAWWARRLDEAGVRVAMDGSP